MVWPNRVGASFVLYVEDLLSLTVLSLPLVVTGVLELDPLPLGWGAVIISILAMVMWVEVARWSGERWFKFPFLTIGPLQDLGNLHHLCLHEDPVAPVTSAVVKIQLRHPGAGEAHTAVSGADDDSKLEHAVSEAGLRGQLVLSFSPAPLC